MEDRDDAMVAVYSSKIEKEDMHHFVHRYLVSDILKDRQRCGHYERVAPWNNTSTSIASRSVVACTSPPGGLTNTTAFESECASGWPIHELERDTIVYLGPRTLHCACTSPHVSDTVSCQTPRTTLDVAFWANIFAKGPSSFREREPQVPGKPLILVFTVCHFERTPTHETGTQGILFFASRGCIPLPSPVREVGILRAFFVVIPLRRHASSSYRALALGAHDVSDA